MQARKWGLFIVNGGLLVRYSSLAAKPGSVGHLTCWVLCGWLDMGPGESHRTNASLALG